MLCLKVRDGDRIDIGEGVEITVALVGVRKATLRIRAPEDVPIRRVTAMKQACDTTS